MSETVTARAAHAARRPLRDVVADYVQISKPRIVVLLLVVAWAAMFVAAAGMPDLTAFAAVTVAGIASTAASGAFNNVVERRRDARMGRTAHRPLAAGRISVQGAVLYASLMTGLAFAALAVLGAWLAAGLTVTAVAYYVLVYTVWLKPTTPQNIVIGGFAGSFPALIGWAALEGTLAAWAPWVIAGLVFLWTPPHFWALALLYKEDYAAADYPMHPIVRGEAATRRSIVAYSITTLLASVSLVYPLGDAGLVYLAAALLLGGLLVARSVRVLRAPGPKVYRSFFLYTIQYLGFLLLALMVDRLAPL